MKIAAAAYALDFCADWAGYAAKTEAWVQRAAAAGADLLVFPEYGGMELAALGGAAAAADLGQALITAAAHAPAAQAHFEGLARAHGVHILAPSGPVAEAGGHVNRAALCGPEGLIGVQDKQIMTRFEREDWAVSPGGPLRLFETALGRVGVLICYDAEFPLLGRALVEAGAQILLVPSATEAEAGYWRVRIGAMARALEGQCIVVHAPLVGPAPWCPAVDENFGAAGIYGPPDCGFPATGLMALGQINAPGWVMAEVDLAAVAHVRRAGAVLNHAHWPEQHARLRTTQEQG